MPPSARRTWPQRLTFVFVIVAAIACFVAAGAIGLGQYLLSQRNLVAIEASRAQYQGDAESTGVIMPGDTTTTTVALEPGETTTTTTMPLVEPDAANFLLAGADSGACDDQPNMDNRSGLGERSDTIMVWRANPVTNQLSVLSFPRDLWVTLPGGRKGRINEAFERNDPSRLIDTLQINFGVPVDHYIQVDFCAFRQLVDAVGGVEVPFEYAARDKRSGLAIPAPGCVNLQGDMALAYVRSRHYEYEDPVGSGTWKSDGTSDFGRIARQQDFLRRTIAKAIDNGLYKPNVASALISANQKYLVTDAELTPRRMLEFANTLRNLDTQTITTYRIDSRSETTAAGQLVEIPLIQSENMRAILAVFRGEALLETAPDQGSDTTAPSDTTPAPTTTDDTTPVVTSGTTPDGGAGGGATSSTLPEVSVAENVAGVTPPRDLICP